MLARCGLAVVAVCVLVAFQHSFFSSSPPHVEMKEFEREKVFLQGNFVVFSTSLDTFARNSDYDFLAPLTAVNWDVAGFCPIVIAVASSNDILRKRLYLWRMVLPKRALVVPIIVKNASDQVIVAQMSRLFGSALVPELSDDAFLRVTDADMFVGDPEPFLPSENNTIIDIYNGNCCRQATDVNNKTCKQYPMHSVGMRVALWRKLFPLNKEVSTNTGNEEISLAVLAHTMALANEFGYKRKRPRHGDDQWFLDQLLLGCVIDSALNATVHVAPGPGNHRVHVNDASPSGLHKYVDAHLAGFQLARHVQWLRNFASATGSLGNFSLRQYDDYFLAWSQHQDKARWETAI